VGLPEFKTLSEMFVRAIALHAKLDCFLVKEGGRYRGVPSEEALWKAAGLARVFEQHGVGRGDRVAILAENRLEWALSDYALLGLGAIPVPIYTTLLEPDIEYILRDSGAKGMVVATATQLAKVVSVRPRLPELKFVLAMDCAALEGTGATCWESDVASELEAGPEAVEAFQASSLAVQPQDVATIIYTSGTMGQPKGVILTHANIVSNVRECAERFPLSRQDVNVSVLPLCHVFQRLIDFLCLSTGTSVAYAESLEAMPQNVREVRPTLMGVVPRVLEKIHDRVMQAVSKASPARRKLFLWALAVGKQAYPHRLKSGKLPLGLSWKCALADALVFSKVRRQLGGRMTYLVSGAAPLARELGEFFHAVRLPVYEGYGLTETSPVIAVNYPGHVKLGTVGPLLGGVEIMLGEEGGGAGKDAGREILVRGPNVSPGYYHLDEENRAAFRDGWFATGDLGALDDDGYLRITGRKKNLFKTSLGKFVCPEKLESLFQGHPYVHQIVVLGDGRKYVGALIVPVFSRLAERARAQGLPFHTPEELAASPQVRALMKQFVDEAQRWLPPFERIRQITLLPRELTIDEGELSVTLKIKRRVVEEKYRDLIEEMFSRRAGPGLLEAHRTPVPSP